MLKLTVWQRKQRAQENILLSTILYIYFLSFFIFHFVLFFLLFNFLNLFFLLKVLLFLNNFFLFYSTFLLSGSSPHFYGFAVFASIVFRLAFIYGFVSSVRAL